MSSLTRQVAFSLQDVTTYLEKVYAWRNLRTTLEGDHSGGRTVVKLLADTKRHYHSCVLPAYKTHGKLLYRSVQLS